MVAPEMTPGEAKKAVAWFVAVQKDRTGPFSSDDLKAKIAQGELSPEQRVWRQGLAGWARSKDVPEVQAMREVVEAQAKLARDTLEAAVRSEPRWHAVVEKKPVGPFSDDQVEARIVEGKTQDASLLWRKGQAAWLPLSSIDELKGVRERAAAVRASNAPPVIPDDDDEPPVIPPTITVDDTIVRARAPHSANARNAAPWSPSTSTASASSTTLVAPAPPPSSPVPASRPVRSTEPAPLAEAHRPATPKAVQPPAAALANEPTRFQPPTPVDLLARGVHRLYPDNPRVSAAVNSIQKSLRQGLKVGDPHVLDAGLREMGNFIAVARERRLPGADGPAPEVAQEHLHSVHAAAAAAHGPVVLCNRHNLLAERTKILLGVVQRPSWGGPVLRA